MKGIFTGSLTHGFRLNCVVEDEMAEATIASLFGEGLVDALDVRQPSSLDKQLAKFETGNCYVIFYNTFGAGASLYGPLKDQDLAEAFGEDHRSCEEEWSVLDLDQEA